MIKKRIVIGNWKMNPLSLKEAEKMFSGVVRAMPTLKKTQVVICPPFLYIEKLKKISKKVFLGAQDSFAGEVGAFTGEVSPAMLYEIGVRYVILGHSERRAMGETNELINKKIKSALSSGLSPVVCVGEILRDEAHEYFNVVKQQVKECLSGIPRNSLAKIVIAYEPVWSISTTANRRDATSADSLEMSIFIKRVLSEISSPEIASNIRILYGGSVNEKDAEDFLRNGGVDGVLSGRASLNPKKFIQIVKICEASDKPKI